MDAVDIGNSDALPQWLVAGETFTDEELLDTADTTPDFPKRVTTRYQHIRSLGTGGSGEVVLAHDNDIGRRVAIKRYTPTRDSGQAKARFLREVRTLGELEHPHIVPIHDVGLDDEGYYFVMRLVEGETLKEIIRRLREGEREAHERYTFAVRAQIGLALIHATAYAHAKGIVHRDIKPANVMVGTHGEVQLVDWGIATRAGQTGAIVGSPAYMAPEQATAGPVDARSDVYSLGVLLHELFTLDHYLREVDTVERVLEATSTTPVPFASTLRHRFQGPVPAEFAWVVDRATGKRPHERYDTADLFAEDLQRALDGDFDCACPVTWQKWTLRQLGDTVDHRPMVLPAMVGLNLTVLSGLMGAVGWMWVS